MDDRFRWVIAATLMEMIQACGFSSTYPDVKRLAPEQAKVIMDVRTEAEHRDRHIPGTDAIIPVQELSRRILSCVRC